MSLDACAGLVARGDPDRYLTVLAAPLPARRLLLPIYAFNVEVSRAPWVTAEPLIAEMRLQWWRDVLEEIGSGGPVRRHEVASELAAVLEPATAQALDRLVAARRWDIGTEGFADDDALMAHLEATAGTLMWVAARALGAGAQAEQTVRAAGRAAGLAAWLRAVPALTAAGRHPLPNPDPAAIAALSRRGLADRQAARNRRKTVAPEAIPALWPGRLARRILSRAAGHPMRVLRGELEPSGVQSRGSLLYCQTFQRW